MQHSFPVDQKKSLASPSDPSWGLSERLELIAPIPFLISATTIGEPNDPGILDGMIPAAMASVVKLAPDPLSGSSNDQVLETMRRGGHVKSDSSATAIDEPNDPAILNRTDPKVSALFGHGPCGCREIVGSWVR